jgi:choice-of-anchor A domain-containing protein
VLATGPSTNTLSLGSGIYSGNVGTSRINPQMNGGTINGNVFLGNGLSPANLVGTINGSILTNQDNYLSKPIADATAAADAAFTLKKTMSRTIVDDAWFGASTTKTITGTAATNVLSLTSINLTKGQTLILSAPAGGKFLLNVTGTFNLAGGASIVVDTASGLLPLDILYNLGTSTNLTVTGTANRTSIIDGIILASRSNISITLGQVNGEVIGSCDLIFAQSRTVNVNPISPIPEVSTILPLLGVLSLATGGQLLRRRRALAAVAE